MLKVSIIIPTFNQAHYLKDAIESAIAQTYINKEIIIADDASTDETKEISGSFLNSSNATIRYFRNDKNIGRVKNYHKSLYDYASGDLTLMLDGDDYLLDNNYIEKAVQFFEQNSNVVLVFAKIKTYYQFDKSFIEDKVNSKLPSIIEGNNLFINYWKGYSIPHQASIYRRDSAIKIGYYITDIQSSDWESVLRLILGQKVGFVNEYVTVWRKHESNVSREMNMKNVESNIAYIENAYKYACLQNIFTKTELSKWRHKMLIRYFFRILVQSEFYTPELTSQFKNYVKANYSEVNKSIKKDLKYLAFRVLKLYRPLLFFATKYFLKQESVLKDLELYRKDTI